MNVGADYIVMKLRASAPVRPFRHEFWIQIITDLTKLAINVVITDDQIQVEKIDKENKRVFSNNSMFSYDKLIIATGSTPLSLFDTTSIKNAAVFRNADDCDDIKNGIQGRTVVIIGSGPIGLELLERCDQQKYRLSPYHWLTCSIPIGKL